MLLHVVGMLAKSVLRAFLSLKFSTNTTASIAVRKSAPVDLSSSDQVFTSVPSGIMVGATGNVLGWLEGDNVGSDTVRTFVLTAGVYYPLRFQKIQKTSTTATGIIILYD